MNAVVAPVSGARKLGDRHDLDRSDAELIFEVIKPGNDRIKSALRGNGSDMKLVDNVIFQRHAAPNRTAPVKGVGIDHFGRSVNAFRLKTGVRIGALRRMIEPIKIARTRRDFFDDRFKTASLFFFHWKRKGLRSDNLYFYLFCEWGPDSKENGIVFKKGGAERHRPAISSFPHSDSLFI